MDVICMAGERFTRRFVVNEYIDVAWDEEKERVQVLVAGEPVLHCAFLVAAISPTDDEVSSIDDLTERDGARRLQGKDVRELLSIDEEVRAHASNIQAWAENGYNTRLLHSNISFTLLKALVRAGDAKAERVLDAELVERIRDGSRATREAILDSCGDMIYSPGSPLIDEFPVDERAKIWLNIGNTLYGSSDMHGAVEAFRKVVALMPDDANKWYSLGDALHASGDMPGAIEAFRNVVAIEPDNEDAWDNLGVALQASGDVPGAVEAHRKAIAINPDDANAWDNLGIALEASGDVPGAVEAHRRVIWINPDNANAWDNLGVALKASGDVPGAIEAIRKAIAIKPDYAGAWNDLSCVYTSGGRLVDGLDPGKKATILSDALAHARKAIELAPDEALYHTTLGEALEASGDVEGAVAAYKKALGLDPKEKCAIEYLERLGRLPR